jgi:cbb3-type cytochrome oxidase maturation protein
MSAITYLIPISIGLALVTFLGFLWTVRSGQYDDHEGNAARMLEADDVPLSPEEKDKLRR